MFNPKKRLASKHFFLGGIYPPLEIDNISKNSTKGLDIASHNLQLSFIQGLRLYYEDLEVVSVLPVSSFQLGYNQLLVPSSNFMLNGSSKNHSVGYLNFPFLKHFFILFSLFYFLRNILFCKQKYIFFLYGLSTPKLLSLCILKLFKNNINIVVYIPDLPNYMSSTKNIFYRSAKYIDKIIIYHLLKKIDKFILISKHIAGKLNLLDNYIVVEGIYSNLHADTDYISKEVVPTIMYAGSLDNSYGVKHLIEAFKCLKNKNIKLWLCGTGPHEKDLKELAKYDSRIIFFGFVAPNEVIQMQKKTTLLVNPRLSFHEFTLYSFPSKLLEYLASATPTITYRMKGIPDEYYEYCIIPESESICDLAKSINKYINLPNHDLISFGIKARAFILSEKSVNVQSERIFNYINS